MIGSDPKREAMSAPLALPRTDAAAVATPADAAVRTTLECVDFWPDRQMVVIGPPGSGRSARAGQFAQEHGATLIRRLDEETLRRLPERLGAMVIDDADTPPVGEALLSALNLCRARSMPLLLIGNEPPAHWPAVVRDLQSRLDALTWVAFGPPCLETIGLRLQAALRRRYIRLPAEPLQYLARHMPRDYLAIETVADIVERLCACGSRPGLPMARAALARL